MIGKIIKKSVIVNAIILFMLHFFILFWSLLSRKWREFTMIGVCSFCPFGAVIWQDISNMSLQSRLCLLCVAKGYTKILNFRNFWLHIDVF